MTELALYGVAADFYIPLPKTASTVFSVGADWTPGAGDVKVAVDGTAANITTLPTAVTGAPLWKVSLSATELTGKKITVTFQDATLTDNAMTIYTINHASAAFPTFWGTMADVAHGGSASVLTLKRVVVANTTNAQTAVDISASGTGNAHALNILASGAGKAVAIAATGNIGVSIDSSTYDAVAIAGGTDSDGVQIAGNGTGVDIRANTTGNITGNLSGSVGSVTGTAAISAAVWDLVNGIEIGLTPRQAQRLIVAMAAGTLSGAGTATEVFKNAVADAKARITATVDASGNRTAITTDLT